MGIRPAFLSPRNASTFGDADVVRAYRYRAPYADETFVILRELVIGPNVVLDAGCGDGALARPIARWAERVDAVDPSAEMLAQGKLLSGDDPRIRWVHGRIEDAPLDGPYGLITAGATIHWWDWEVALPRLAALLAPGARLAIVHPRSTGPWWDELVKLVRTHSIHTDWRDIDMVAELSERRLFALEARRTTAHIEIRQPTEEFVGGLFSHAGLARARLGPERAEAFATAVREAVRPWDNGTIPLIVDAEVIWGRPLAGVAPG